MKAHAWLVSLALVAAACGGNGGGGGKVDAGGAADAMGGQADAASVDAAAADAAALDAAIPDATAADVGPGHDCGGFLGKVCADGDYCDYPMDNCGSGDALGTCRPRPSFCPNIYKPVCACDGLTYGNSCNAAGAGFDVNGSGGCPAPEGWFSCGAGFCLGATSYCERTITPNSEVDICNALPDTCAGTASCDCLSGERCAAACTEDKGNFTLTCFVL